MKTSAQLKKPYGKGAFSRVRHARYLGWEDAFDVEFADGLGFLNRTPPSARPTKLPPKPCPCAWKWMMIWAAISR